MVWGGGESGTHVNDIDALLDGCHHHLDVLVLRDVRAEDARQGGGAKGQERHQAAVRAQGAVGHLADYRLVVKARHIGGREGGEGSHRSRL
jgi:hypothetical protein